MRVALWLCLMTAVALWASRSSSPTPAASWAADTSAQPAAAPEGRTGEAKAGEAEKKAGASPKRQTPEEADKALARLMTKRKPVRAATARGQTSLDAPPFTVVPRQDRIRNFPCTKCHDNKFVDRRVRELQEEHTNLVFEHGGGRFWCYDACHKGTDIDHLVSLRGRRISYDESYKVCGQCHFQLLDWFFGGHGKRQGAWEDQRKIPVTADELKVEDRDQIGRWAGGRVILNCTECHNPDSPSIKPFEPSPPPRVRSGLDRKPLPSDTTCWRTRRSSVSRRTSAPSRNSGTSRTDRP
jgi:hypothetical protein